MSDDVVVTQDFGRVRVISINRPQALNAMNQDVFAGLCDALGAAEQVETVAVCIVTGTGRAFCAGQDLDEMRAGNAGHLLATGFLPC